jgi:hypothetical protein
MIMYILGAPISLQCVPYGVPLSVEIRSKFYIFYPYTPQYLYHGFLPWYLSIAKSGNNGCVLARISELNEGISSASCSLFIT